MTAAKKIPFDIESNYKVAAALHRAKVTANYIPHPDEIMPVDGRLHVALTGTALTRAEQAALFGESRIDIPEFRTERQKLK